VNPNKPLKDEIGVKAPDFAKDFKRDVQDQMNVLVVTAEDIETGVETPDNAKSIPDDEGGPPPIHTSGSSLGDFVPNTLTLFMATAWLGTGILIGIAFMVESTSVSYSLMAAFFPPLVFFSKEDTGGGSGRDPPNEGLTPEEELSEFLTRLETATQKKDQALLNALMRDVIGQFDDNSRLLMEQLLAVKDLDPQRIQIFDFNHFPFFTLSALAFYILQQGPAQFSEDQLTRLESIMGDMKQKGILEETLSLPYVFILVLSRLFKGADAEDLYVLYSRRFEDLRGSFGLRTVALNLLLKSRHLAKNLFKNEWTDIFVLASHLQYAKKNASYPSNNP